MTVTIDGKEYEFTTKALTFKLYREAYGEDLYSAIQKGVLSIANAESILINPTVDAFGTERLENMIVTAIKAAGGNINLDNVECYADVINAGMAISDQLIYSTFPGLKPKDDEASDNAEKGKKKAGE